MKKPWLLTLGDFKKKKILKSWTRLEILSEVAAVDAAKQQQRQAAKEEISTSAAAAAADVVTSKQERKSKKRNKIKTLQKKERKNKVDFGPNPPPELPASFLNKIRHMHGKDIVRVIQKPLYESDVCKGECRFSIPLKQVQQEFLTEQEKILLNTFDSQNNKPSKIKAITLIDPSLNENKISLGKWEMKKKHGRPSSESYVLVNKWREIVEENQLTVGDIVQLWAFRVAAASTSRLCFALVVVKRYDQDHEANNNI